MNFPSKCPYCGKDNISNSKSKTNLTINHKYYEIEIHKCIHCEQPIFVINKSNTTDGICGGFSTKEIIHYYPLPNVVDFPEKIKKLSPNGFKVYSQATTAKEAGYDMLVGAGLRMALEWLVRDYLLKIKKIPENELNNLRLVDMICKMNAGHYVKICADLVRVYGNDGVHLKNRYNFSVDEAITGFIDLCNLIDSEMRIMEIDERLSNRQAKA